MTKGLIVTGTDTGVGKTVFSAALVQALEGHYWKPVQSGLEGETDSQIIRRLSECTVEPETYRLTMPASPHLSAKAQNIDIDTAQLRLPEAQDLLVIEGAGGLMVPLNRNTLFLDMFAQWQLPVILCARTTLGTINHSLLSLMALRQANCRIQGIAFIGDSAPQVEKTICDFGKTARLGRLPFLDNLTSETLSEAFSQEFDPKSFLTGEKNEHASIRV